MIYLYATISNTIYLCCAAVGISDDAETNTSNFTSPSTYLGTTPTVFVDKFETSTSTATHFLRNIDELPSEVSITESYLVALKFHCFIVAFYLRCQLSHIKILIKLNYFAYHFCSSFVCYFLSNVKKVIVCAAKHLV